MHLYACTIFCAKMGRQYYTNREFYLPLLENVTNYLHGINIWNNLHSFSLSLLHLWKIMHKCQATLFGRINLLSSCFYFFGISTLRINRVILLFQLEFWFGSWLFWIQYFLCLVSFWRLFGTGMEVWRDNILYWFIEGHILFLTIHTTSPNMHRKLTEHKKCCLQINQLPTKFPIELRITLIR